MNYYYFGFVLMGSLIEALGIIPSVAYNLAVPSLLALTGVGAYTLASNLIGGTERQARRAGLWGVALGVLLGNLGELKLIAEGLEQVGQVHFESLIPGYRFLVSSLAGLWKVVVQGQELAFRPEWWYWNASRIVEPGPGEYVGPINEFPIFTYLYADLHAHAIALPLTQVALAVALQWGIGRYRTPMLNASRSLLDRVRNWIPRPFLAFLLAALVAGALRATNTWDYPTYLGLMILGYLLPLMRELPLWKSSSTEPAPDTETLETGASAGPTRSPFPYHRFVTPVALVLLAELLFRPFTTHYTTTYNAVEPWLGSKTPLSDYLVMHGHFLLPLALVATVEALLLFRRMRARQEPVTLLASLGIVAFGALLLTLVLAGMGVRIAWIVVPFGTVAALLLLDVEHSRRIQTLWLWVGTALAITLAVEVVVLKGDIGRMNTVFKPYVQVWTLFATTAAVATERLWSALFWNESSSRVGHFWHTLARRRPAVGDVVLGLLLVVVFATALYPLFAIPAKIRDRWNPQAPYSLDGMAYLDYAIQHEKSAAYPLTIDARVIRWLQENIEGSPTIMEKNAEVEYIKWGNRMSIYTGLPTVIGWRWHQAQQRMVMPGGTVERRQWDVSEFYNTPDPEEAWAILQEYGVEYVVLTPYERLYMQPQTLTPSEPGTEEGEGTDPGQVTPEEWQSRAEAKFDILVERGRLEVVFDDPTIKAKVYRVVK
jgi:YYY domain-containing protein